MTADIYKEKDSNLNVTLKIFTLQKAAHVNIKKAIWCKEDSTALHTLSVFKKPALRTCPGHLNMEPVSTDV